MEFILLLSQTTVACVGCNLKNPSSRLVRWMLRLQGYDFDIVHRKGTLHSVPDALSRAICYIDVTESDPR